MIVELADEDVAAVVQDVWQTVLGVSLAPRQGPPADGPTLDGTVPIGGDWQGAMTVQVARPLADRMARIMFALGERTPSSDEMRDAVGELANMTGGNVKALIDGECRLGLPVVVDGGGASPDASGARVVSRIAFGCEHGWAVVTIVATGAEG